MNKLLIYVALFLVANNLNASIVHTPDGVATWFEEGDAGNSLLTTQLIVDAPSNLPTFFNEPVHIKGRLGNSGKPSDSDYYGLNFSRGAGIIAIIDDPRTDDISLELFNPINGDVLLTSILTNHPNGGSTSILNGSNLPTGVLPEMVALRIFSETNFIFDYEVQLSNVSFFIKPVPLPGAVWLFGSGLIGLIGMKRKSSAPSA